MNTNGMVFCESVRATGTSPWCLRPLTHAGMKPNGGIDTGSLCGRVQPPWGWDIDVPVSSRHSMLCKACKSIVLGERES